MHIKEKKGNKGQTENQWKKTEKQRKSKQTKALFLDQ